MHRRVLSIRADHWKLIGLLLTPVILWSTVFPFSKMVLTVLPPATLAAVRFSTGAIVLLLYASRNFTWAHLLTALRRHWATFLLLGSIGIWLNNFLQNVGLSLSTASSTSLLSTTDPIFSTLLSALFLREALTGRKLAGLFLAFSGVYLVTTNGQLITDWGNSAGNLIVIAAALCYSVYTILSKRILHVIEPSIVVAWSTTIGAVLLSVTALCLDEAPLWSQLTSAQVLATIYLSIVPTSVSVLAYFYVLRRLPASEAAISLFLIPIFSLVWSKLLLQEQVTLPMLIGGGLIIAGVALAMLTGKRMKQEQSLGNE